MKHWPLILGAIIVLSFIGVKDFIFGSIMRLVFIICIIGAIMYFWPTPNNGVKQKVDEVTQPAKQAAEKNANGLVQWFVDHTPKK